MTTGELIFGAFNKTELNQILKDTQHLKTYYINKNISKLAIILMRDYSLSHNLKLPDALIAATALSLDIPLYTLNIKDFRYINSLSLWEKWTASKRLSRFYPSG